VTTSRALFTNEECIPANAVCSEMLADRRMHGVVKWSLFPRPYGDDMRVPDDVKKCVVFIGESIPGKAPGPDAVHYGGTGFFVHMALVGKAVAIYLVTAKHVADALRGKPFLIRANTKTGESKIFEPTDALHWHYHPSDTAADVAVMEWCPPVDIDYQHIDSNSFVDDAMLNPTGIGIGSEVHIIGLFKFHHGSSRNHPLLRTGNIAMIPDERIEVSGSKPMEAYLIEARSIGGLSGSPVFAVTEWFNPEKKVLSLTWALLGLTRGHWEFREGQSINDFSIEDSQKQLGVNVGIAIVTPAKKILDILNNAELTAIREKFRQELIERDSPKPD
jgi:hypothetical protein